MVTSLRSCLAALCAALILAVPASASDPLPVPEGDVVLTVDGDIARTNRDGAAVFDRAMLRRIGETSFETSTIWTEGPQRFTGVSLSALMAELGVTEADLIARAINDYAVEIPVGTPGDPDPIVAYAQNGEPMSIRSKGPLWIVYPYDADPALRTETIYSRSIWQLDRITVRP